ncbi:MAG: PEP-CTERM sorting domain-containing protein [Verrucomicrobiales bacterium]|jgi:hypothetical protein|nr:PEP-CTERM sorting domain-containing protein [Verrucomicrobiales bacterium]
MKTKLIFTLAALTVSIIPAQAANVIWNSSTINGLWSDNANWQGDSMPASGDTAVFTADTPAGLVKAANQTSGGGYTASGIEFQSGGWELRAFFMYTGTINNTGNNTIHIISTPITVVANWNIAAGSELTIQGATRSDTHYSINIGHNTAATLNVNGGGTLILNDGIFGQIAASNLVLKDSIDLVINKEQIFNVANDKLSGIYAFYTIGSAAATLSIKTTNTALLDEYVVGNYIRNTTGEEFVWTQYGDYYTYALQIPEPSTFVLLSISAMALTVAFLRRRG